MRKDIKDERLVWAQERYGVRSTRIPERDSIIQGALASRAAVQGGVVKLGLKSSPVPCQAQDPNLNAVHPQVGDLHYNSYKVWVRRGLADQISRLGFKLKPWDWMKSSEEGSIKRRNETNTDTQNKEEERQRPSKKSEEKRGGTTGYYKIPSVRRQEEQDSKQYKWQKAQRWAQR